jgi:hypothetical protein
MSCTLAMARINKCRVLHAIRSGKISGRRDVRGDPRVERAEPRRVSPNIPRADDAPAFEAQLAGLKQLARLLRAELEDLRQDRDAWRHEVHRLARADRRSHARATSVPSWLSWCLDLVPRPR